MPESTAAILLAGGTGSRMGSDQAKQFIRVAGKPVLCHSFDALRRYMPQSLIVVVVPFENLETVAKHRHTKDSKPWHHSSPKAS